MILNDVYHENQAYQLLKQLREESVDGQIKSLRGFMKLAKLGFGKSKEVIAAYAEAEENNMSVE